MMNACYNHPDWYYDKFDKIFYSEHRCIKDIFEINKLVSLSGHTIQEIGAGTGNHAIEILKYEPSKLCLVDVDENAIPFLNKRFNGIENIEIKCKDGLQERDYSGFNINICMYSIIQQYIVKNINLAEFIYLLHTDLQSQGYFIFEFIDQNISSTLYPSGKKNSIYKGGDGYIEVESIYYNSETVILFSGCLDDQIINYSVTLRNIRKSEIEILAEKHNLRVQFVALDEHNRRNIACIQKP